MLDERRQTAERAALQERSRAWFREVHLTRRERHLALVEADAHSDTKRRRPVLIQRKRRRLRLSHCHGPPHSEGGGQCTPGRTDDARKCARFRFPCAVGASKYW